MFLNFNEPFTEKASIRVASMFQWVGYKERIVD